MSDYRWVKINDQNVELRKADFSLIRSFSIFAKHLNDELESKLKENGIKIFSAGDGVLEPYCYILRAANKKTLKVAAPLYEYNFNTHQYELLSEEFVQETRDPKECEWVEEIYLRCQEELAAK